MLFAISENSLGSSLPSVKIDKKKLKEKFNIIDLVITSNLEKSKSEVRRLIKGSAIKINNNLVKDEKLIINEKLFEENYLKLSIGKKKHIKIELD